MPKDETDLDEGQPRRVDVQWFLVHPTMDPAEITAAMGLEARFAHRVGDPRVTPTGIVLGGQFRDTRWRHCARYELKDQWFADKITMLVNRLVPHKAFFAHIRGTGGKAQVVVQFLGDGYLGDSVPADTLAKIAELQLDFGIECFVVPQS
jgi:hypothetical protein